MALKEKKEFIVLGALVAVLCVVAVVAFSGPKRRRVRRPAQLKSAAQQGQSGQAESQGTSPLPTPAEMEQVVAWLAGPPTGQTALREVPQQVLGLEPARAALRPPEPTTAAVVPASAPFVKPPSLEGILWCGERRVALIGGEAYEPGQKIKDTVFRVAEVAINSVILRTDTGQELTLDLRE